MITNVEKCCFTRNNDLRVSVYYFRYIKGRKCMELLNHYKGFIIIGISGFIGFLGIVSLIKKPKALSRFEAFWTALVLCSEGVYLGFCINSQEAVLEIIFLGVAIFLLWVIILFLFRRPKFEHRGIVMITCLVGIILYLALFYLNHFNLLG